MAAGTRILPPPTEVSAPAEETGQTEAAEESTQAEEEPQEEAPAQEPEEAAEEVETETVYLLAKSTNYNTDGSIRSSEEYTYDEAGRKTASVGFYSYGFDEDSTSNYTYEYEFFDDSSIKKETRFKDGSILSETEYDADGNQISYHDYYDTGILSGEVTYTYENGVRKTTSQTNFDESGEKIYAVNDVYDEFGTIVLSETWSADGSETGFTLTDEYICEYNDAGLLVKSTSTDGSWVETFEYDSRGNEILYISELYDTYDGSYLDYTKNTYTYDEHNNRTNLTSYNEDGTIASCLNTEYTYDADFNIIKSVDTDENGNILREEEYIAMELPKTE